MGSAFLCGCTLDTLLAAPQLLWDQPAIGREAEMWAQSQWEAEAPVHGLSKLLAAWQSSGHCVDQDEHRNLRIRQTNCQKRHEFRNTTCTLCGLQKEEAEAWGAPHHPTFMLLWAQVDLPSRRAPVRGAWELLLEPCTWVHSWLPIHFWIWTSYIGK